jgi:hypothetical protein
MSGYNDNLGSCEWVGFSAEAESVTLGWGALML